MIEVDHDQLKQAVEHLQNRKAKSSHIAELHEPFHDQPIWDSVVHVFTISDHPDAKECYAWSPPIEGTERREFYAVLAMPPINSAVEAVRAAIASDHKTKPKSSLVYRRFKVYVKSHFYKNPKSILFSIHLR